MLDSTDWIVIATGLTAVLRVNWYFFAARAPAVSAVVAAGAGGAQEVTVTVLGGYSPATIRARAGAPLRIVFDRQESGGCSEEVVFADFGVRSFLPPFARTTVEVTPSAPGRYGFTCGMGMLRGTLVVD